MTTQNLTNTWLPIAERRKNACRALSTQIINKLKSQGWNIDGHTDWFIDSIFQRVLVGPKAYRVYDVFDKDSQWHDIAKDTIKDGTIHHMYLKENNLQYGIVRDSWCKQLLSTGLTKEQTIRDIVDLISGNEWYLNFVKRMGINRRS